MIAMVFAIPTAFGLIVWNAYRRERGRARKGEAFAPEGKLRWGGGRTTPR
jgi:hypothetical protein